jgi:hypothetical protein
MVIFAMVKFSLRCSGGPEQAHGVILVPVAEQREFGEQYDLAYVTRREILHFWTKFQVCGPLFGRL